MPTTGIARREGLRGLGEELIRLDARYQSGRPSPNIYICSWSYLFNNIVSVADSGLNDVLHPYDDPLLLERHGEQLLNFVIRLASKQQWKSWLDTSMRNAVSTAAPDIFLRLFAAYEDPVGNETLRPLLNVVSAETSVEMLSALVAAAAGRKEPSVSATAIARRGELRGLGGELVRLDMQHQSGQGFATKYYYSWSNLVSHIAFDASRGWSDAVRPHDQNALLGSLGEHYFDIAIRLASKEEWESWLDLSTRIAVLTAATDVLPRLLAAYDDPVGDDTLTELLDVAAEGGIVDVLPALIAAGAGPKERLMSDADLARREGVRGLGGELVRLGVQHQRVKQRRKKYCFSWSRLAVDIVFVADSELHAALWPFTNAALLESHGEQLLDFFIRLASDEQWKSWLDTSAGLAASTGRTGVLLRLFAAYEGPVDEALLAQLLNLAAHNGHVGILSALLDAGAGAKVREVDEVRWPGTALHLATRAGHRAFVAKLIEVGAPVDTRHSMGGTALTDAVEGGHTGVALELLAAGADVDKIKQNRHNLGAISPCRFGDFTPLGISVSKNDENMANVLLEAGADPIVGPTGDLPLHIAARKGGFEIANHLLLAGASVSSVDTKGRTALHIACAHNHQDVVGLLLRHNSNAASMCSNGQTPTDVVGTQALARRQPDRYPLHMRCPSTLNSAETSTVDTICGMLQSASAWGRRGWLVLMRSRPLAEIVEQSIRRDADDISRSVGALSFAHDPCKNTEGVLSEEGGVTPPLHDGGNASADCGAVVVWLLQEPDECLFRYIVQFL